MTKPKVRAALPPEERHAKPTDSDEWPSRLQNAIRAQIRSVRLERGLTFDALSDRCRDLGYPISRVVLSKIEAGFRPSLSVPELLVIARALDVPPALILAGDGESFEAAPGMDLDAEDARQWLSGGPSPDGVWVAYWRTGNVAIPFATEIEALRYALENAMSVSFVKWCEELVM